MNQIQEFIYKEIQQINEKAKKPGWTNWAVISAIAAAFWLLSGELESGKFIIRNIHINLVLLLLFFDIFSHIRAVLLSNKDDNQKLRYFTFRSWKSNIYLNCIYSYLYYFILIVLIIRLPLSIPFIPTLVAIVYASLCLLAVSFLLVLTIKETPLSFSSSSRNYYILGLNIVLPLVPFTYILVQNNWSLMQVSQSDIRIASLVLVIFFLIKILIPEKTDDYLLDGLVNLKRSHFLGYIDDDVARHQLELLLLGHKVSDFIQPLIYDILSELSKLQNLEHDRIMLSNRISEIRTQNNYETLEFEIEAMEERHIKIDKMFEQGVSKIVNLRNALDKKVSWLVSVNKDSASESDLLIEQMDREFKVALDSLERMQNSRKVEITTQSRSA
jgi:hypothetical protein